MLYKPVIKFILENIVKQVIPGSHLLINTLIAISKKGIEFPNFDSDTFYQKLADIKEDVTNVETSSATQRVDNFEIKFINQDERKEYNPCKEYLSINAHTKNTDWCLNELHTLSANLLNFNPYRSHEVSLENWEKLIEIKKTFITEHDKRYDQNLDYRYIDSVRSQINVDDIKEVFEILVMDCPNIRYKVLSKNYNDYIYFRLKLNNLSQISKKFIGRRDEFNKMNLNFEKKQCLIITSELSGTGKTVTAEEFCKAKFYKEKWNVVYKFMCETEEKFNLELKIFAYELFNTQTQSMIPENALGMRKTQKALEMNSAQIIKAIVNCIDYQKYETNFLFIFDNMESFKDIKKFTHSLIPCENCKFIITTKTRIPKILDSWLVINLLPFDSNDISDYISKNCNIKLDKNQIMKLMDVLCIDKMFDTKMVLPKSLENAVNFMNENNDRCFDDLLRKLKNDESYLITFLKEKSPSAFKLYLYTSVLDPDMISKNILKNIHSSINEGNLDDIIKLLLEFKFIEISSTEDCYNMHRVTQEAAKIYLEKNKTEIGSYEEILQRIMKTFLKSFEDFRFSRAYEETKKHEYDFIQLDYILKKFSSSKKKNSLGDLYFELRNYLGKFYLFLQFDYIKALEIFQDLQIYLENKNFENKNFDDKMTTAYNLDNIVRCYFKQGKNKEANDFNTNSLKQYGEELSLNVENFLSFKKTLAMYYFNRGIYFKNLGYFSEAFENFCKSFRMEDNITIKFRKTTLARYLNQFGICLQKLGENEDAIYFLEKSYKIFRDVNTEFLYFSNDSFLAEILNNIGYSYYIKNENETAFKYLNDSYEIRKIMYDKIDHPEMADSLSNMGLINLNLGKYDDSLDFIKRSLEMRKNIYEIENSNTDHPDTAQSWYNLGLYYIKLFNDHEALECFNKSYDMRCKLFKDPEDKDKQIDHPDLLSSINSMILIYNDIDEKISSKLLNQYEIMEKRLNDYKQKRLISYFSFLGELCERWLNDPEKAIYYYNRDSRDSHQQSNLM